MLVPKKKQSSPPIPDLESVDVPVYSCFERSVEHSTSSSEATSTVASEFGKGFRYVCQVSEMKIGTPFRKKIKKTDIALFLKHTGDVFAISNPCSHNGHKLSEGAVEEIKGAMCVVCPAHGIKFNVETGEPVARLKYRQKSYPVKVREGEVWVRLK